MGVESTAPYSSQPVVMSTSTKAANEWSSGLFECANAGTCLYAWFLPQCATASIRSEMDGSNCVFNYLAMNPIVARHMVRNAYGIEGSAGGDMCLPLWCTPCVIAQVLNEVRSRGPISSGPGDNDKWQTGLFDWDFTACVLGCFLPYVGNALALEKLNDSNVVINLCCMPPALAYNIVREGYGIEGNCCLDILIMAYLGHCGTARIYQETQKRGKAAEQKVGPGTSLMK